MGNFCYSYFAQFCPKINDIADDFQYLWRAPAITNDAIFVFQLRAKHTSNFHRFLWTNSSVLRSFSKQIRGNKYRIINSKLSGLIFSHLSVHLACRRLYMFHVDMEILILSCSRV